jgi:hypothetical protein
MTFFLSVEVIKAYWLQLTRSQATTTGEPFGFITSALSAFISNEQENKKKTLNFIFLGRKILPRQGPSDPPSGSKPQIHDSTRQNRVSSNPMELLVRNRTQNVHPSVRLIPSPPFDH